MNQRSRSDKMKTAIIEVILTCRTLEKARTPKEGRFKSEIWLKQKNQLKICMQEKQILYDIIYIWNLKELK